jgi:enoyl-CoA hydratase
MGDSLEMRNGLIEVLRSEERVVVRLATPETRNALSANVLGELESIIDACEAERDMKEILFTGTGTVFAAGADLREIAELNAETARGFALRGQRLLDRISSLECRTTAAINGYCYGGGLDLALACSTRIAHSKATFCHPGVGLGIITGWGGTQRLPKLIGQPRAFELLFTAEPVSAEQALEIGLVDSVDDEFFRKI